jgi:hypothetical protein
MPVKRRQTKARPAYPDAVERLVAGLPIEMSDDARDALVGVVYFADPELDMSLRDEAMRILRSWPPPGRVKAP